MTAITENAKTAQINYNLWVGWYPGDIEGAVAFASDHIETEEDIDGLEYLLKAQHEQSN